MKDRTKINARRNYRNEYDEYQSSPKRRKYRADLNRRARRDGHYGKTPPGTHLVHKNGQIAGLGNKHDNLADGARKATAARIKARGRRRRV